MSCLGPPFHSSSHRRARAQTELPSSEKAERTGPQGSSTGKGAAPRRSPERPGRECRGTHSGAARPARSRFGQQPMRLSTSSPAAVRQQRADQLRRDRAAALTLRSAFPAIQQLRFDLQFEGTTANTPTSQSHELHPPARAFFTFPCPYSDCDGRFDLTGAVNGALADPSNRSEGVLECAGVRAWDHGSKQPCRLRLVYTIAATCGDTP